MKLHLFNKYLILILTIATLNSCTKSESIPQELEVHDFIWKGLNAYYLWQSDIPDLQDNRFSNQSQLNDYLTGFSSPEQLFESLLNRPTDRFSVIVDDYIALENAFQGITLNSGMEFGLVQYSNGSESIFGYVRYVLPSSDAETKGVSRGMIFNTVDNTQLTTTNFRALLFGNNTNFTIGLSNYNNGNPTTNGNTITLSKTQLQENPVALKKVFNEGAKKIGYLMYNQFSSSFDGQLNAAFSEFKSQGVTDLVIDLRYNSGGSVKTATHLGSMITGQFTGQLYSKESWNEKVQKAITADRFINNFTNQIRNTDRNGNVILEEAIQSLNLTKVYFIVSSSSASASELVINSLRSYIDVALVGDTTRGKQEGSITLYDSDNLTRTGDNLNPNHTYAMQPLVLEIVNADDKSERNGFTPGTTLPGVLLKEDYNNLGVLGQKSDPLLDRMITYIISGNKGLYKQQSFENRNIEIFNSKLGSPTKDNMYVDLKR
ncbi:S41 family peptidase [Polaribacter aquimarinus]|uniref:Peptidase S41 n=1 Tax=Polaribacter aquimarinus TaxID=2100726 RepID=A0A2U2J7W2_9FLAO|nr:S41 family peptidase [Polaribacter aquimarinus]PWG04429.1 peptidase S41 [Polaribacter aquimarinus]